MARVTVEDCIENIPNRFELLAIAARRAKQISSGNPITIDRDNDKDAVVSLREIAGKTIEFEPLKEEIIESYSRYQRPDVIEGVAPPPSDEQLESRGRALIGDESAEEILDDDEANIDPEEFEKQIMGDDMPDGMDMSFDDEIESDD